ncbi:MAG: NAD(P)/FAD-dependent oxidoreductase, partial [Gemmatimonadales bacterium]
LALWQGGIARVAVTEVESAELRSKVAWQQEHGHACDWLDAGALWAPQDGALDPKRLVQALRADAERSGAVLVNDRAVRLDRDGERITGVIGEKDSYSAAEIVVAAGAWSGKLQGLPRTLPVRPVRGQMAAVPWPAAIPPAIVYHKDCYLLSRRDEAIIGSTMEDAGFNPGVTSAGLAQILAATVSLSPALMRAKVRRTWAGLRPMTPDGLPIIGRETRLGGLWYATGHGRNGILLAGITGLLVRQLIDGQQPTKDLRALSPDRF